MLKHLGVGDANPEFGCRLLDRTTLQETQFQDPPVVGRQPLENIGHPLWGSADRSSLSGGCSMSSIEVISRPRVSRQCAASTVRAVARR